jgi:DNA-binding transcriptional LysR family regulator
MLSLPRLRLLSELSRRGTIAATARALAYTPSAVSQQLSLLEREVGTRLLERAGRGVLLTEDALLLVEHAEAAMARLERAEAELASGQQRLRGRLRVASFQSVVLTLVPGALDRMSEAHPALRVEIVQREHGQAYQGLLSYEFDVILGEEYPGRQEPARDGIDRSDLLIDPLRLALPDIGALGERPRHLSELTEAPWVLDPDDTPTGRWARETCRRAGFEPNVRFESPDPLLHAELVRTGHAVAFLPELISSPHLQGVTLASLPGDPHRVLYTASRSGRAVDPAVRAFREALADVLEARRPAGPAWGVNVS